MLDLVVFTIGQEKFAISTESVKLVLQTEHVKPIPNYNPFIDGIISYKDEIIKVVNFRKLLGFATFESGLKELFLHLQQAHKEWIEELRIAVENKSEFTKTIDPHKCELGIWLDEFNSYDDRISNLLKDLIVKHKSLHRNGGEILQMMHDDYAKAKELLNIQINETYQYTMNSLQTFIDEYEVISESIQKLIVYEGENSCFALKVDGIYNIIHVEKSKILPDESGSSNNSVELEGMFNYNNESIKVIRSLRIPK